jgi:hypothetical protein
MADSILFATPCYGGMVTAQHHRSCILLQEELTKAGPRQRLADRLERKPGPPRPHGDGRDVPPLEALAPVLDRRGHRVRAGDVSALWNLDADIAVGVYAMKKREAQWFAAWKDGKLVKDLDQFTGPIDVDYAGTGFMLIKREVLETLAATVPIGPSWCWEGAKGNRVPALFMTPIHNDGLESEDYHFCRIAREAGFKIVMDPKVRLKHWGQYAYGA